MSNTQNDPRPSDVQSLIDAIHDNMSMSDGCHGHYRALAKLLAMFIASEKVEHSVAGDLKRLSAECLSVINLIDAGVSYYETTQNNGRAQQ